jgi:hypothetical protein
LIFPHLREITFPKAKSEKLRNALDFAKGRFEAWGVQPKIHALPGIPHRYYPTSIQAGFDHGEAPPPLISEEKPDTVSTRISVKVRDVIRLIESKGW